MLILLQTKLGLQNPPPNTWSGQQPTTANPSAAPSASVPFNASQQNGTSSQNHLLNPPPGVHPPSSFQQQQQQPSHANLPYNANDAAATATGGLPASTATRASQPVAPQTPAQQVLMSPADRWGLLSLLALIKNANADESLLSIGTDLGTMGLDMQNPGYVVVMFINVQLLTLFAGISILHSSRHGPTHLRHIRWSPTSTYRHVTMYTRLRLIRATTKRLHLAKRHYSSCSMRTRETCCRKSQRRSCT